MDRNRRDRKGLTSRPGCLGALARFWRRSYAADYVSLAVIITGWILIQVFVQPFHRMFSLDDRSIQYPFAEEERVTVVWSIIYSGLIPLLVIALWSLLIRPESHFTHMTILGLIATLATTSFVTDIIKNAVGRPRPDLLSRCHPTKGTPEDVLVDFTICSATDQHILHEGWRSFPSGHSSFAFGGLGYLALFFAGQLRVYRPRSGVSRLLFSLSPLLGAALIGISRLADYRHDVYDVSCGSILGATMAYTIYRCYYPSLFSPNCNNPHPPPDNLPAGGFDRVASDEEQQLYEGHPISQSEYTEGYPMQPINRTRGE